MADSSEGKTFFKLQVIQKQGRHRAKTIHSGCREDPPCSQPPRSVDHLSPTFFLRFTKRKKAGEEHHYWSLVANKRVGGGRGGQRHVLYLGEINDSQQEAWRKSIEIFEDGQTRPPRSLCFPRNGWLRSMTPASCACDWMRWRCGGPAHGGGLRAELPSL